MGFDCDNRSLVMTNYIVHMVEPRISCSWITVLTMKLLLAFISFGWFFSNLAKRVCIDGNVNGLVVVDQVKIEAVIFNSMFL